MNYNSLDLDINNYNLDELLSLFDLPINFDENDLRRTKKIVLKLHPDKSKLDPQYFLFYSKAYKMIYSMYLFKNKNEKELTTDEKYDKNINIDESIKHILDIELNGRENENKIENEDEKRMLANDFNKKFNKLFEKYNSTGEENNGYEEWLRGDDKSSLLGGGTEEKIAFNRMNVEIENKKKQMREIIPYKGVDTLYFNTTASSVDGSSFSNNSDLFSSLHYQDLKQAHTETLIPVTEDDYNNITKFNSINDYKLHRDKDEINWKFNNNTGEMGAKMEEEATKRAYKLAKQMEESKIKNELFLKEFRLLNN
jgi:hypothetical protein